MDTTTKDIIDFKKTKNKLLSFLDHEDNAVMILSTSTDNVVTSRPVLIVHEELNIYLFTWKYSRKYFQIEKNKMISLCKEKVEIEGIAEILGLMTDEKNRETLEFLRRKQPNAIKRWENKPNMVIIKIEPTFASVDGYYMHEDAYIEYIDFIKQYAYRQKWGYF